MDECPVSYYKSLTTRERIRIRVRKDIAYAKFRLHGVWWRFLWATKLGRPYSKFLCRNGWYTQYREGVCGYCGEALEPEQP